MKKKSENIHAILKSYEEIFPIIIFFFYYFLLPDLIIWLLKIYNCLLFFFHLLRLLILEKKNWKIEIYFLFSYFFLSFEIRRKKKEI